MDFTTFTSVLALGSVIYMAVNFVKYLRAGDWNGVLTLLLAMVVGSLVVWLASAADVSEHLKIISDGPEIGDYDAGSIIFAGIALASTFSLVADLRSAFDNTDTANKPPLVPPAADARRGD